MGTADAGVWKLLLYPLAIVLILALFLNLTVKPFIDNGIFPKNASQTEIDAVSVLIKNGTTISVDVPILGTWTPHVPSPVSLLPQSMQDFIVDQFLILASIPNVILIPLVIIFSVAIIYAIVHIIQGFIP